MNHRITQLLLAIVAILLAAHLFRSPTESRPTISVDQQRLVFLNRIRFTIRLQSPPQEGTRSHQNGNTTLVMCYA
jgi:hypothetical protein